MDQDELLLGTDDGISDFTYLNGDDIDALLDDDPSNANALQNQHFSLEEIISLPSTSLQSTASDNPSTFQPLSQSCSAKESCFSIVSQQSLDVSFFSQPVLTSMSNSSHQSILTPNSHHQSVLTCAPKSLLQATPISVPNSLHCTVSIPVLSFPYQSQHGVASGQSSPAVSSLRVHSSSQPCASHNPLPQQHSGPQYEQSIGMGPCSDEQCLSMGPCSDEQSLGNGPSCDEQSLGMGPSSDEQNLSMGPLGTTDTLGNFSSCNYTLEPCSPGPFSPGPFSPELPPSSGSPTPCSPVSGASTQPSLLCCKAVSTSSQLSLPSESVGTSSVPDSPLKTSPVKKLIRLSGSTRFSAVPHKLPTVAVPARAQKIGKAKTMFNSKSVKSAEPTMLLDVSKDKVGKRQVAARMKQRSEGTNGFSMPVKKRFCAPQLSNLHINRNEQEVVNVQSRDCTTNLSCAQNSHTYPQFEQALTYPRVQRPAYPGARQHPYPVMQHHLHVYPELHPSPCQQVYSQDYWTQRQEQQHWFREEFPLHQHQSPGENPYHRRVVKVQSKSEEHEQGSWYESLSKEQRFAFGSTVPSTQGHVSSSRQVTFSLSHLK